MLESKLGKIMIEYKEFGLEEFERIKEIYKGETWSAYLHDDESLKRAFEKSLYRLGAYDEKSWLAL